MNTRLHQINISIGNFFFKYRNGLFPVIYFALLFFTRPRVMFGNEGVYHLWILMGGILAVLGQTVRFLTIGYKYIERAGKEGKVYASFLVQGGIYAHARNPMYIGNGLIAIGLLMFSGSPVAAAVGIPLFIYIYHAITSAEEAFLSSKFGKDYDDYCAHVNRFIPSLKNLSKSFTGMTYNWKRAIRKDYGTATVVLLFLVWLPIWRGSSQLALAKVLTIVIAVFYATARFLKKSGYLHPVETA